MSYRHLSLIGPHRFVHKQLNVAFIDSVRLMSSSLSLYSKEKWDIWKTTSKKKAIRDRRKGGGGGRRIGAELIFQLWHDTEGANPYLWVCVQRRNDVYQRLQGYLGGGEISTFGVMRHGLLIKMWTNVTTTAVKSSQILYTLFIYCWVVLLSDSNNNKYTFK